jgi:hypothetical protein
MVIGCNGSKRTPLCFKDAGSRKGASRARSSGESDARSPFSGSSLAFTLIIGFPSHARPLTFGPRKCGQLFKPEDRCGESENGSIVSSRFLIEGRLSKSSLSARRAIKAGELVVIDAGGGTMPSPRLVAHELVESFVDGGQGLSARITVRTTERKLEPSAVKRRCRACKVVFMISPRRMLHTETEAVDVYRRFSLLWICRNVGTRNSFKQPRLKEDRVQNLTTAVAAILALCVIGLVAWDFARYW